MLPRYCNPYFDREHYIFDIECNLHTTEVAGCYFKSHFAMEINKLTIFDSNFYINLG